MKMSFVRSWLLVLAVFQQCDGQDILTKYVCGSRRPNFLYIRCPAEQIIAVRGAVYGRLTSSICPEGAKGVLNCTSNNADRIVKERCDGRNLCRVKASDRIFRNPCRNRASKYLEVSYACLRSRFTYDDESTLTVYWYITKIQTAQRFGLDIPQRKYFHMLPCQSTTIMGKQNGGFPQARGVGRMYLNSKGIVTWENTYGRRGRWQWLGWRSKDFINRFVKVSFDIRFINRKPRPKGYEIKICGQVYRFWATKCQIGKWCRIERFSRCVENDNGVRGVDDYVILNFGGIAKKQKVQVANFVAETRPVIEMIYTTFDGKAIIMNSTQGLPYFTDVGMLYPGRIFDETFRSNEIITWQNTEGRNGVNQWFGWRGAHFASKILRISFGIKFENKIPDLSSDFGFRVYGVLYNKWIKSCTADKWCFVDKVIQCAKKSTDDLVMLIFNSINHTQTIHVGKLRLVVLKSEEKIFNILPTNPRFMGGEEKLPRSVSVGRMYIDEGFNSSNMSNKTFHKEEIITYENTQGEEGSWQWMGWKDSIFINKRIQVSFWIYFQESVPLRSPLLGLSVCGKISNEFVRSCSKDTWCFVMVTMQCKQDRNGGESGEVCLTFDTIFDKRIVRVSQLNAKIL